MATTVYITCNPIHILYSLAINKTTYSNKEYFIMWFGAMPVENYFKPFEIKKYCRIIDLSHLNESQIGTTRIPSNAHTTL